MFARERQWSLDGWKGFFWHGSAAGVTGVWKHARGSCSISLQIRNWSLCWYRGGWRWGGAGRGAPAGFPPAPRTCVSGSCVFPFRFLFNAGGFHSEFSPTSPYASFPRDGANKEAIAPIINLRESLLTRPRQKRNVCPDDGQWRASLSESRWIGNAARQHTHTHTPLCIPPALPTPLRPRLAFHLTLRLNCSTSRRRMQPEPGSVLTTSSQREPTCLNKPNVYL